MRSNFDNSLKLVLVHEGGYANHPRDPGGVTLQGITQRTYDAWRKLQGAQPRPLIGSMQSTASWRNERDAIYRKQYWDVVRGDELPAGVDYVVFDGAVNSGASRSVKWLQRALGVRADGVIGEITLSALRGAADHDVLIAKIIELRTAFLKSLKTWADFGKGWLSRVRDVLKGGQAQACGSVAPKGSFVAGCNVKALADDAKSAPSIVYGDMATGAGTSGGLVAGTLNGVAQELAPFADVSFIRNIIVAISIISALLAIGGIAYRIYAKHKQKELEQALDVREVPV